MPWISKKPDLKNDPRYLEGKVNDTIALLADIVTLKPSGGDDTTAINNLITTLANSGGGTVKLTNGVYNFTQIRLKKGVYLTGNGDATVLRVMNGVSVNPIILADDTVSKTGFYNLFVDGNKVNANYTALVYVHRETLPIGTEFDTHFRMANVKLRNSAGDGLLINKNSREGRFDNLVISNSNGIGVHNLGGTDNFLYGIVSFANKGGGFKDAASNNHWTACKAFGNGDMSLRSAGFLITTRLSTFVSCEAQENYGHGFHLLNANNIDLTACSSNANGITGNDQTVPSDLLYNGFEIINSYRISVSGKAYDFRKEANGAATQKVGIHIDTNCNKILVNIASSHQQLDVVVDSYSFSKSIYVSVNGLSRNPSYIYNPNGDNYLNFMSADPDNSPKVRFTLGESKSDNSVRFIVNDSLGNYQGTPLSVDATGNVSVGSQNGNLTLGNLPTKKLGFFGNAGIARPTLTANATDLSTAIALVNDIKAKLQAFGITL